MSLWTRGNVNIGDAQDQLLASQTINCGKEGLIKKSLAWWNTTKSLWVYKQSNKTYYKDIINSPYHNLHFMFWRGVNQEHLPWKYLFWTCSCTNISTINRNGFYVCNNYNIKAGDAEAEARGCHESGAGDLWPRSILPPLFSCTQILALTTHTTHFQQLIAAQK